MDKNKKLFYTIIGAISEEIDDIVSEKEPEEAAKEEPQAEVTADELAEEE